MVRTLSHKKRKERKRGDVTGAAAHLVEHAVELVPSLRDAVTIVAIHHEDQTLGVLEVVPPQRADLEEEEKRERGA